MFKLLVSFYLLATYIVSHIDQALCSESYGTKQNDTSQQDCSDFEQPFNTAGKENCTASAFLCSRSDWPYYWIYFTNWNWTLTCLSFWIDSTLVVLRYRKEKRHVHTVVGESNTTSGVKGLNFKDTNN